MRKTREAFAAALAVAGYDSAEADEADMVRQVEDRFVVLYLDPDTHEWTVTRFHAHGAEGHYDALPLIESGDRDVAADAFLAAV